MSKRKSIYDQINDNIVDGKLSEDFALETGPIGNSQYYFAPGARDGIYLFHMKEVEIDENNVERIHKIFELAIQRDYEAAEECLMELMKNYTAIQMRIIANRYLASIFADENMRMIFEFSLYLMVFSDNIECVKYGIDLITFFVLDDKEEIKELLRKFSLCEELALFTCLAFAEQKNAEDELLRIAKLHKGWGRIHAIQYMEPTKIETKEWLIKEGVYNTVSNSYTALTIYEKAQVFRKLIGIDIKDRELVDGVFYVIDGLLKEDAVYGFSRLDNDLVVIHLVYRLANDFLCSSEESNLTIDQYEILLNLLVYINDGNVKSDWKEEEIDKQYDNICEILKSKKCLQCVQEALKIGRGIDMARALRLDINDKLFELLKKDFDIFQHVTKYLMEEEKFVKKVIDIYCKNLNVKHLYQIRRVKESKENLLFGKEGSMVYCVQQLKKWIGYGKLLIGVAVTSPVIQNRNMAINVIEEWERTSNKKLKEIDRSLYLKFWFASKFEKDKKVKKRLVELLK